MKIITVDIGNTHIRAAQFINNTLIGNINHYTLDKLISFLNTSECDTISVISVVENAKKEILHRVTNKQVIIPNYKDSESIQVEYKTELGIDRYVDVLAATHLFPNEDLIVIDSGSATTVDIITKEKVFRGGYILPGIGLKARAISEKTDKLPLIDPYSITLEHPNNTTKAIKSGILLDTVGGVERAIKEAKKIVPKSKIIACGGGWEIFGNMVEENSIFVKELTLLGTAIITEELMEIQK